MHRNDGSAELVITDDGPGIAALDRESVFDAFTRLDTAPGSRPRRHRARSASRP